MRQRAGTLIAFFILGLLLAVGATQADGVLWSWDLLGVPRMPSPNPAFTDTISVTHSMDCLRAGFDPYVTGRCDPWGRLFNYPPIWLEIRHVGVSSGATHVIGIGMAVLTAAALIAILRAKSATGTGLVVLAILSPAVMFGIERGNVDTLLFSALILGLALTRVLGEPATGLARGALIALLTALKAYPIAACLLLAQAPRRGWALAIGAAFVSLGVFLWTSWAHLTFIFGNTPLTSFHSFGAAPLFLDLAEWRGVPEGSRRPMRWLGSGVALVIGLGAAWVGTRAAQRSTGAVLPSLQRRTLSDEVCLACLAVFCFSFLLGSNYNYRLIFLLGTLPRLIEEWEARGGWQRLLMPCLVLALLWAVRLPTWAGHGANWLGYLAACAWLAASLPPTALTSASARRSRTAQVRAGTVSGVRREVTQVQTGWRR